MPRCRTTATLACMLLLAGAATLAPAVARAAARIEVVPSSLALDLFTGDTARRTLTVSNPGDAWLTFGISLYEVDGAKLGGGDPDAAATAISPDLTGVRILMDTGHSSWSQGWWSDAQDDLVARGAQITVSDAAFHPGLLAGKDVLWVPANEEPWTAAEVAAVRDWVLGGGGLLLSCGSYADVDPYNALLADLGAGITFSAEPGPSSTADDVHLHPTTRGVTEIFLGGDNRRLPAVLPPAVRLVEAGSFAYGVAACAEVGAGRVLCTSNRFNNDYHLARADNRLFSNQVFDWLAHRPGWIDSAIGLGNLGPGLSADVAFDFDAAGLAGGTYQAEIWIASNAAEGLQVVPATLQVTGAPNIALPDTVKDFGPGVVGQTRLSTWIQVYNHGAEALLIPSIVSDHSAFTPQVETMILQPAEGAYLSIMYEPLDLGPLEGTLTITSNDPDQPVTTVRLLGYGLAQGIPVPQPDSLHFSLPSGATTSQLLEVGNGGDVTVRWILEQVGGDAGWLDFSPTSEAYQEPDETVPVLVSVDARHLCPGVHEALLRFHAGVSNGYPDVYLPVVMEVTSGAPEVSISRDVFDLGAVTVGEPATATLRITNLACDPLHVTDITADDPDVWAQPTSLTVASGDTADVIVGLTARDVGQVGGTLTLLTDDPDEPSLTVTLGAYAYLPAEVATTPDSLEAHLEVGQMRLEQVTLTNAGTGTLAFTVALDGFAGVPAGNAWATPTSGILAPGASVGVSLFLSAADMTPGPYPGSLVIGSAVTGTADVIVPVDFRVIDPVLSDAPDLAAKGLALRAVPNPFNPVTEIRFRLPRPGRTEVRIHDLRGALVMALDAGAREAGDQSVTWRGRDRHGREAPSGTYVYRLLLDGRPLGRAGRMALVR